VEDGSNLLTRALVERGYRVVTYDSRDAGASTHFDRAGKPDWRAIHEALVAGTAPPVAYTSQDLAADAVGLLDALHICRAHIVGGSLGGMVAQIIAADYPDHALSLTSISSSTGNPGLPPGPASALVSSPVGADDPHALFEHQVKVARALESPAYRLDEATLRARVAQQLKRPEHPDAVARQGAAAAVAGDRRSRLRHIGVPTMVIHGDADPVFPLEHGRDTAANIPGAELLVIPGMGHDLPDALTSTIADAIEKVARRAGGAR
jgi:pimeloyl-ACP methyl ester carboxylesterase